MNCDNSSVFSSPSLSKTHILLVGAGGIGCELLKLLVISGYKNISVVDMDKIEKSNLNRQFLFDRTCIGKYKSEMAVESVKKARNDPSLNLKSYVGNIKDKILFPDNFFETFSLIVNALDNIDARYYINSICMKKGIPLIDSGSEGYLGSVSCYIKGETPCYNCSKKIPQKTIPICSIRLKPEKIEHCVGWGKALFEKLFSSNTGNKNNKGYLEDYDFIHKDNEVMLIMQKLFYDEIVTLKKTVEQLDNNEYKNIKSIDILQIKKDKFNNFEQEMVQMYNEFYNEVNKWYNIPTFEEIPLLISLFVHSFSQLKSLSSNSLLEFDKENDDIITFIYSASNLRAFNFLIPNCSKFDLKQIAGNIIPAISSTNNIVASIQVIESLKLLSNHKELMKNVNFVKDKSITSSTSSKGIINPNCATCSASSLEIANAKETVKFVDFKTYTLSDVLLFIKEEIKDELYEEMQIQLGKDLVYEKGEGLEEDEIEYYENEITKKNIGSFNAAEKSRDVELLISYGQSGSEDKKHLRCKLVNRPKSQDMIKESDVEISLTPTNTKLIGTKRVRSENSTNEEEV